MFLLEQDSDMRADRRLRIHVGKLRRGAHPAKAFNVNFNFDTMDFSEVEDVDDQFVDSESESRPWANYDVNPFDVE